MHVKSVKWKMTLTVGKAARRIWSSVDKKKWNLIFLCALSLIQIPVQVWIDSVGILHVSSVSYRPSPGIMLQPKKRQYCSAVVSADVAGSCNWISFIPKIS